MPPAVPDRHTRWSSGRRTCSGLVGTTVGISPWVEVTQADIDLFARVTRDEQWIHVDRQRAAAGPFGTTIAHGYFVLSLCAYFGGETL